MKRVATLFLFIVLITIPLSCEKETMLTVNQSSLSFNNSGGSQTVNLLANKVWSASSNQGWCKVSPSSGDGSDNSNFTLSVSCEANTMYDERSCMITVVCEELTTTITVTQAEGKGLIVSQTEYNLSNEAQTISVEVQANVQYSVSIDDACKSWIKQESTKGLSLNTIKFAISKNESYDGREGKITVKQTDGSLSGTVVVKQSQTNAMIVDQTAYDISYEEQQLSIKVMSNINYEVQIDDSCKGWISRVGTKGLTESTVTLAIAKNEGEDRTGSFVIKFGSLEEIITVSQRTEGYVEFEDPIFKAYCVTNFDKNGDGEISMAEAMAIAVIYIEFNESSLLDISSLQGIEAMPNLKQLSFRGIGKGKLTNFDISNNKALTYLSCEGNQLTSLDVSNNTALTYLCCYNNQLTSLDISNNTALTYLNCDGNQLTSLDVSKNTALEHIQCGKNHLTSLDVSKNTALERIQCWENHLTNLDVSNNPALTELTCNNNQLTSLDLSNDASLKSIACWENHLTSLDVSNNTALTYLNSYNNQLTNIDISNNTALTYFNCDGNQLTSLDVSKNTALEHLYCDGYQLTSLDVSNNTALTHLYCDGNQLTSLDLSNNKALTHLFCNGNQLTSLDLSNNKALTYLYCYNNQLTSLDVSNNTALTYLYCRNNQLTSLDVSNNTALTHLYCDGNQLTSLDVSNNGELKTLWCMSNLYLKDILLKTNQTISDFKYDKNVATIKYK